MKKYLSLLIVLTISIFVGAGIARAAAARDVLSFPTDKGAYVSHTNSDDANKTRVTDVTVFGIPQETAEITGTDHWVVKLKKNKANTSDITVQEIIEVNHANSIEITNFKLTDTGAEFDVTYKNAAVTKDEKFEMFTLKITQGPSSVFSATDYSDCGGSIGPVYTSNSTDNKGGSVPAYDTGFSIPVAIIGVGSLAGLAIVASTSKKTKMHRI